MRIAAVEIFGIVMCFPLGAQWIDYPTPGIPRTSDGKPNLSAPAPKAPDGKPDLSGIWEHLNARTTAYYLDGLPGQRRRLLSPAICAT
jgi:hypothetical protein